jgi:hypothetical protein
MAEREIHVEACPSHKGGLFERIEDKGVIEAVVQLEAHRRPEG